MRLSWYVDAKPATNTVLPRVNSGAKLFCDAMSFLPGCRLSA
jgi:hypothetical protein